MSNDIFRISEMKDKFEKEDVVTYDKIVEFYKSYEKDVKTGTIKKRIYSLKKKNVIYDFKKGYYKFYNSKSKEKFSINLTENLLLVQIQKYLKELYPYAKTSIWDTKIVHDFMVHQPFESLCVLEVENEILNSVYHRMTYDGYNVYLCNNPKSIENLIYKSDMIILKRLTKDAPLIDIGVAVIPKVEKVLIDLFYEDRLYITYQGKELQNIFNGIMDKYMINWTTLYRYARNRRVKERLIEFINDKTHIKTDQ